MHYNAAALFSVKRFIINADRDIINYANCDNNYI